MPFTAPSVGKQFPDESSDIVSKSAEPKEDEEIPASKLKKESAIGDILESSDKKESSKLDKIKDIVSSAVITAPQYGDDSVAEVPTPMMAAQSSQKHHSHHKKSAKKVEVSKLSTKLDSEIESLEEELKTKEAKKA